MSTPLKLTTKKVYHPREIGALSSGDTAYSRDLSSSSWVTASSGGGGGSGGVSHYTGVGPPAAPSNTAIDNIAYSQDGTGPTYTWNIATQQWV